MANQRQREAAKKAKQEGTKAALIAAAKSEVKSEEAKDVRKARKRAAADAQLDIADEIDEVEAKRLRKAAKRAAAEDALAAQVDPDAEVDEVEAKRQRKAATRADAAQAATQAEANAKEIVDAEPTHKYASEHDSKKEDVERTGNGKDKGKGTGKGKGGEKGKNKAKDSARIEKEFEVFVRGLPFSATADVLWKDFAECGEIANFHLPLNDEGNARGIAFIEYTDMESVDRALKFHDTEYGGRWIQVRLTSDDKGSGKDGKDKGKDGKGKGAASKGGKGNKELEVFIGGLAPSMTEEVIRKDFEECGKIVYCRVPVNDDGSARGIAFVEFSDQESVDKVLKYHDTEYGGRSIQVRLSGEKGKGKSKDGGGKDGKSSVKGSKEFEVFVGGLPFAATEETLRKDLADCGDIVSLTLPLNAEGKARGIAFIEFKDKESCDKAIRLNDTDYGGRRLEVRSSSGAGKGKGKKGSGITAEKKAARQGAMGVPEGTKHVFEDSDNE